MNNLQYKIEIKWRTKNKEITTISCPSEMVYGIVANLPIVNIESVTIVKEELYSTKNEIIV